MQQWNIAISSHNEEVSANGEMHKMSEVFSLISGEVNIKDSIFHLNIKFKFEKNVKIFFYPINSVSNSESGVESVFQGISINILPYMGSYKVEI